MHIRVNKQSFIPVKQCKSCKSCKSRVHNVSSCLGNKYDENHVSEFPPPLFYFTMTKNDFRSDSSLSFYVSQTYEIKKNYFL